jgi:hypothetical protein
VSLQLKDGTVNQLIFFVTLLFPWNFINSQHITMKMKNCSKLNFRHVLASGVGAAVLTQFAAPASAASFNFSEDFNSVIVTNNITTAAGQFTVTSGNIDVIGTNAYDFYPGNGNYIDLNGDQPGTIATSAFTFNTGDVVTLAFNYGANGDGRTADVTVAGNTFNLLASQSADNGVFNSFSQTFTVGSDLSSALSFIATSGTDGGIILDNISLTSVSNTATSVPEPSEMLGTMVAFGSVVLLKRKLSKKQK